MINALILAAGLGSRLRPLTTSLPKPMLQIGSETMLGRLIRQLNCSGLVSRIFVNISHQAGEIAKYVVSLPMIQRPTLIWESYCAGTAFTVTDLGRQLESDLLVIHGDLVVESSELLRFIRGGLGNTQSLIGAHYRPTSDARSCVKTSGSTVVEFTEQPSENDLASASPTLVNSGIYFFKRLDLDVPSNLFMGKNIAPFLLNHLIQRGRLDARIWNGLRISVETVEDLAIARSTDLEV